MTSPLKSETPMTGELATTPFFQQQADNSNLNIDKEHFNYQSTNPTDKDHVQQGGTNNDILPQDLLDIDSNLQYLNTQSDASNTNTTEFQMNNDLMDIDQLPSDLTTDQSTSPKKTELQDGAQVDSHLSTQEQPKEEDDPIIKIKQIELLPDLYKILYNISQNKASSKDFVNLSSLTRSKINNLKNIIKEIDGINISPNIMMEKIQLIHENNLKKQELMNSLILKVNEKFS
ncbi:uncharacterized protein KGF55_005004 [Candida pseudojiufengensis]|uniref:uncharacterized protein n=1 Tax=Candida pseudojiufengensis TaxID=497109 RepID=UPI00222540C4|nr:uncharacterized protein KGF55_005004 [Candida pseudojiufengensis]KAI5959772.1 hypothetical protein KGF55_005004 [Candida pseudojiufengensis]